MPKQLTERELRRELKQLLKEEDFTAREWATDNGITPQQVTAFLRREQGAGLKIPKALGYKPLIVFVRE